MIMPEAEKVKTGGIFPSFLLMSIVRIFAPVGAFFLQSWPPPARLLN